MARPPRKGVPTDRNPDDQADLELEPLSGPTEASEPDEEEDLDEEEDEDEDDLDDEDEP